MASRVVAAAAVLALLAAGCGGAKHFDPNAPRLITRSLEKARTRSSVRFHADLTLGAKLGEAQTGFPREQLDALAGNRFHLVLDGARSDSAFIANGTLEAAATTHDLAVRQVDGHLFLRLDRAWYRLHGTIGRLFQPESLANLVPQEACVNQNLSEGCDAVDFVPPLERGEIGRSMKGSVEQGSDGTVISGTVDAAGFTALKTGTDPSHKDVRGIYEAALGTLLPYEKSGKAEFAIGKDGLPRRFVFSYRLEGDALKRHLRGSPTLASERDAHIEIDLSDWGSTLEVEEPAGAAPLPRDQYERLFRWIFPALYLYL